MNNERPDFFFSFLEKGKVINASLMPDVMDERHLSFSWDSPEGDNYVISMIADGTFDAQQYRWSDELDEWEETAEYGHADAKQLALEAGIIQMRKAK